MPVLPILGARGGLRAARVLGPRVLGVAPAHLGADPGVGAIPEAGEIVGDCQRPPSGGEQVELHPLPAVFGRGSKAEALL